MNPVRDKSIVIVIPAYNEEQTIGAVIESFAKTLPGATICVVDNNSGDNTHALAAQKFNQLGISGGKGLLIKERRKGKAYAIKTAFYNLDFDVFVMVDADLTYPADQVHQLLAPVLEGNVDMVIGDRHAKGDYSRENKRQFHGFGNSLVRTLINMLFNADLHDILSGYRVFSRDFAKNFPILSKGFELETEITLHALDKDYRVVEIPVTYLDRPEGSVSKLNTFSDGLKVIKTIGWIFKDYRPLSFFGMLSLLFSFLGFGIGALPVLEFIKYHYVHRVPSAILATGFIILAAVALTIGIILDTVAKIDRRNFELRKIK